MKVLLALSGVAAYATREERTELLEDLINGKVTAKQISDHPDLYVSTAAGYSMVNLHEHPELDHYERSAFMQISREADEAFLQSDANTTANATFYGTDDETAAQLSQTEKTDLEAEKAEDESLAKKKKAKLDNTSVKKAIKILNGMIENAVAEIDKVTIRCKAFHRRSTKLQEAIKTDLTRLGAEMADLDREKASANECITQNKADIDSVKTKQEDERNAYKKQYKIDSKEMTIRKNDLAVADFIMKLTRCKHAKKMAKKKKGKKLLMEVPEAEQGEEDPMMRFADPEIQAKLDELQHPESKALLRNVLSASFEGKTLMSKDNAVAADDDSDYENEVEEGEDENGNAMSLVQVESNAECMFSFIQENGKPGKNKRAARKCSRSKVNMCLINDNMSMMWGEMKDAHDQLKDEMAAKENAYEDVKKTLADDLAAFQAGVKKCSENLAEATSTYNSKTEEQNNKMDELMEAKKEFKKVWGGCNDELDELVYTKMCGVKIVRSDVRARAKNPEKIVIKDCEVSDFTLGKCRVRYARKQYNEKQGRPFPCDPAKEGKAMAGIRTLVREIDQMNNTLGTACPKLTYMDDCNAFLCPIHCKMSSWTGYGKCSKDCESGEKMRTRTITTEPLNGGMSCENVVDTVPCNTMSCDRNCKLHKFTSWTPCSQACDGGFKEKFAKIRIPIRGRGTCPKPKHHRRYRKKGCNKQRCYGDETCVAKVDMVIAVDSSGSFRQKHFGMLTNFTGELLKKFKGRKWKGSAMKVGLVQFGNGAVVEQGGANVVLPAKINSHLTFNMKNLQKEAKKMAWQGGFTNMAQAFIAAKEMFLKRGRKRAQSQVLVITDGKPSFLYQTTKEVNALKDAGVKMNFVVIHPQKGSKEVLQMKKWASSPWQSHMVYVKGNKGLKSFTAKHVTKSLVQFCPKAWSPKYQAMLAKRRGFKLVVRRKDCLDWWWRVHKKCRNGRCYSLKDCSAAARKMGAKYFVMYQSRWWGRRAWCYAHRKNDGKCRYKRVYKWWWFTWVRKGWTRSVFNVYALEGEVGANEAKKLFLEETERKKLAEHGYDDKKIDELFRRPTDGAPGSRDEETEAPGHMENRDPAEFPDDMDEGGPLPDDYEDDDDDSEDDVEM